MKKILKQTLKRLFSFPVNVIASTCLVFWTFWVANHSCLGADEPTIPMVAQGHEAIYKRFLNGALIYRPNGDRNDEGMITLPIRDLANPLEGTFDLSRCGDTGEYLSISTGYRKEKEPKNKGKVEIWFAPRFLIEKELQTTAKHFQPIFDSWEEAAQVGIFWAWGAVELSDFDYLTTENMDELSKNNLYKKWKGVPRERGDGTSVLWGRRECAKNFMFVCI